MKYQKQATFEQILAYRPEDVKTHTPSPIVNALADTLYTTKLIECVEVAEHLGVEYQLLTAAVRLETGLYLKDIIQQYRLAQLDAFRSEHADKEYTVDEMAHALGYANGKSIARFLRTKKGETVRGRHSIAEKDNYVKMRSQYRKGNR